MPLRVLVIDGQGGRIGKLLVEAIKKAIPEAELIAVGTNSAATSNMIKGGADQAATGENSVIVCTRTADVIVGPLGITVADSMLGEVTPAMAVAVGQSKAKKLLLPMSRCNNIIIGMNEISVSTMVEIAVEKMKEIKEEYG